MFPLPFHRQANKDDCHETELFAFHTKAWMFCLPLSLSAGDDGSSPPPMKNMTCYHKPDHGVISSNPLTKLPLSPKKNKSTEEERAREM